MSDRILPTVTDLSRPFWEGGLAGELRFQRCTACGHLRYPIDTICPRCLDAGYAWEAVSGTGTILAFGTFRRAYRASWEDRVPYAVAIIQTTEGPRLIVDVVEADPDELHVDDPVEFVFEPVTEAGIAIPHARPVRVQGDPTT
ncbi:MAG: OB-fold domain-containing protein [Chloroflexi bacterium]|nr:OB-fold domain-containing protein [Chloroflexota bacterium]